MKSAREATTDSMKNIRSPKPPRPCSRPQRQSGDGRVVGSWAVRREAGQVRADIHDVDVAAAVAIDGARSHPSDADVDLQDSRLSNDRLMFWGGHPVGHSLRAREHERAGHDLITRAVMTVPVERTLLRIEAQFWG